MYVPSLAKVLKIYIPDELLQGTKTGMYCASQTNLFQLNFWTRLQRATQGSTIVTLPPNKRGRLAHGSPHTTITNYFLRLYPPLLRCPNPPPLILPSHSHSLTTSYTYSFSLSLIRSTCHPLTLHHIIIIHFKSLVPSLTHVCALKTSS